MKRKTKIEVGFRLLFASLILFVGGKVAPLASLVFAGIVMTLPSFSFSMFHRSVFGVGFTDEQKTELKELLKGVKKENEDFIKETMKDAITGSITSDGLVAALEKAGIKPSRIKEIDDAVGKHGEQLLKLLEGGPTTEKDWREVVDGHAEKIAGLDKTSHKSLTFDLPSRKQIQKTTVIRTALSNSSLGYMISGLGELETINPVMSTIFPSADIGLNSNGVIRYVDRAAATRNAAGKAEAAAFPESVATWVERTASLEKIADSIPVSKEALRDISFIKSEIETLLNVNLVLKEDQALYSGTGIAPEIKGINEYAVTAQATLAAAPYADTVESANLYDLVAVLRVVIMLRGQNKYNPNYVLLNPADVLKYRLLKGTDGHYVLPPFISADGKTIDTVRVIETTQVVANTLQIGDSRYGKIYRQGGIEMELGYVNDQFVKDLYTLKASQREYLLVRTADVNAFAKITDITAAIALLETP